MKVAVLTFVHIPAHIEVQGLRADGTYHLQQSERITIGRVPTADIRIVEPNGMLEGFGGRRNSTVHFWPMQERCVIRHMGHSLNICVNGQAVWEEALDEDDRIDLGGGLEFVVRYESDIARDVDIDAARHPALALAILDNPDNEENYLVYADWLQNQGDPRGELAMLQNDVLSAQGRRKIHLQRKHNQFLAEHIEMLLPGLVPYYRWLDLGWTLGFVRRAVVDTRVPPGADDTPHSREVLRALLMSPAAEFLTDLSLATPPGGGELQPLIAMLLYTHRPEALRRLSLGTPVEGEAMPGPARIESLEHLGNVFPKLERLEVYASHVEPRRFDLPALLELTVHDIMLSSRAVNAISYATWPSLHTLRLRFGVYSEVRIDTMLPILDGQSFPVLENIDFGQAEFATELCEALPFARILPRLRQIRISGTVTDRGVHALWQHWERLRHLDVLDIEAPHLSPQGRLTLHALQDKLR